jgi:hypothetical protein
MAMHYFHMANGHTTFGRDGTNLPDLTSVRKEALRAARDMLNLGDSEDLWGGNRGGFGSQTNLTAPDEQSLQSN